MNHDKDYDSISRLLDEYVHERTSTMGFEPIPPPFIPQSISDREQFSDCPHCGAAVRNDKFVDHEEWHETLTQAIREQIEEGLESYRQQIEAINKKLVGHPNIPNDGHRHRWEDKSVLNESPLAICDLCGAKYSFDKDKYPYSSAEDEAVLGRCIHGIDLDHEFCYEGCKV